MADKKKSDGGPSSYYDFDPGWNTFNDFMESKALEQWGPYSIHLKDIGKGLCRFGVKDGTSESYDARKMIYSALRILGMLEGHEAMHKELTKLLADKQFVSRNKEPENFIEETDNSQNLLNISYEQRKNLKILADYLSTGNTALKFDMGVCNNATYYPSNWECGSVACAAGHGPAAGIRPLNGEGWGKYIERVFGPILSSLYIWVFSEDWQYIDNTPQGAAKRIYYTLENGVPEDHENQMRGDADYIFKKTS